MGFWKNEDGDRGVDPDPGAEAPDVLLGPGVELDGKLVFPGTVRIDARFKGSISADGAVLVGDGARIEADITCGDAIVDGAIEGSIRARSTVEIHARARVRGDVQTPSLSIERGAVFEGRSRMSASSAPAAEPPASRGGAASGAAPPAHA